MGVRRRLAQYTLCLGLMSLRGDSLGELPLVQDLRKRDIYAWDYCLSQISENIRKNINAEDLTQKSWDQIEYEVALLFRELRRQIDERIKPGPLLPWGSSTLSPQESMLLYCAASGFRNASPAPLGMCDISAVQLELSRAAIFARDQDYLRFDVNRMVRLGRSLPFGMFVNHWQLDLQNRLSLHDLCRLVQFQ